LRIRITSLTEKGIRAISKHVRESKSLKNRLMMNRFFSQAVVNEKPYILLLVVKDPYSKLMKFKDLKPKLDEALIDNGATELDYIIEEVSL